MRFRAQDYLMNAKKSDGEHLQSCPTSWRYRLKLLLETANNEESDELKDESN